MKTTTNVTVRLNKATYTDMMRLKPKHMRKSEWARHLMAERLQQYDQSGKTSMGIARTEPDLYKFLFCHTTKKRRSFALDNGSNNIINI